MRTSLCLASLVLAIFALAACENAPAPRTAATPTGTQLGDTGVRVSGTVQAGGAATVH